MGEIADLYAYWASEMPSPDELYGGLEDRMAQDEVEIFCEGLESKYRKGILEWTTKGDEKINVKDLGDSHLGNLVRFTSNSGSPVTQQWHDIFKTEQISRDFDD